MSEQRAEDTIWNLMTWRRDHLDEHQRKAVAFAEVYVRDFGHGAIGHNDYILITRLAELLDVAAGVKEPPKPPEPHELRLTFGKYSGRTLGEIRAIDYGYLEWLAGNARDEAMRSAAATVIHDSAASGDEEPPF
ncbi:MAG TPA: hypothetical protein VFU22_29720 [Roseiflexaceae bacterium]|nr:hypothetical protein [Roseiflexaceae bacterium]